ncbi:MAG: tRNA uridine-5-carboxymethylaminomethyl(34) synthesis GTPase MnmE [Fibromonadaceae bacterium]|jgi:tRNA modification GTPase|nr:tRNA uridine-5-carboxymethylaminomethyl(34) synthesis GTPase MnmE [Fibromonadaceae bacterium]
MSTIVALATPLGVSAIAVVRVSGPAVKDICKIILPNFDMKPRTARLVNTFIDTLLAIYFPAPNSHTGEDILELFPHGNPFIVRKLIEEICKIPGTRLAERGEFTERAFLNGKIDLTQAEALGDLLSANNSKKLANARKLLTGEISAEIKTLAENLKEVSALLELEVDFAEDVGVDEDARRALPLRKVIENIQRHLQSLKKRFRVATNELPRVVLFGAPNAGKSTLINALVKEERLLVSEVPGTTRDFVEVPLHLPSGDVLLIDTAGLASEAQSNIDKQAMQKTCEILEKANLKILVIDVSIDLPPEFKEWEKNADMVVLTHIDIACSELRCKDTPSGDFVPATPLQKEGKCSFNVAVPKNTGIKELREKLEDIFFPKEESEEVWITSERQIACIKKAEECVERALELLSQSDAIETIAFEMREARNALCSITGEISDESILNAIFSSYCIGK